jgi:hypothetical protein
MINIVKQVIVITNGIKINKYNKTGFSQLSPRSSKDSQLPYKIKNSFTFIW